MKQSHCGELSTFELLWAFGPDFPHSIFLIRHRYPIQLIRLALDLSPLRLSYIYSGEQSFNENIQKYCWILPARTNDLIFNIFWNSNWISQLPPSLFFRVLTLIRTFVAPGELGTQVRLDSRWLITKCCLSRIVMLSRDSKGISELPLIQLILPYNLLPYKMFSSPINTQILAATTPRMPSVSV